jgi:hypothetical protein
MVEIFAFWQRQKKHALYFFTMYTYIHTCKGVVLSSIAFGILRTNRVPPDIFRHFWQFFTDFSTFRHFPTFLFIFSQICCFRCASAQICGKMNKNVGKCRKVEKSVKNCQKLSENVGKCEKLSKTVGKCRVAPDWYVKCGKWCSTIQQVQNQFLFLVFIQFW